ncbi:glycoside hydrolase [Lophium mytilinum]|uniref:alpha-galactosidase n=1 Tax=Lophium mytilinum TaxID=390894 RepID=A0A6A6REX1_9PEZI|nr:glycoside hydrolase [Lophium mytilinum]
MPRTSVSSQCRTCHAATPLKVIRTELTPNGFTSPPRGWNSFPIQANPSITASFSFDQAGVITQCDELAVLGAGYEYCSLDSGWSVGDHGDDYGRITDDPDKFDLPALADHLHSKGLKVGVYVLPGAFCNDADKTIEGTSIKINDTMSGNNNGFARCDFDFAKDGVQQWHNSVVKLFAEWGVDLIKLDYITPGSPDNGGNLPADNSGSVIAFHKAIQNSGREIRLDISWKLDRSSEYFPIWASNADSMRTDQDVNESGSSIFVKWVTVQRAIDNYRDFIASVVKGDSDTLTIYPDMDNLLIGNAASISGVSDVQRQTIATHWFGAAANLIVGSDLTNLDYLGRKLLTDPDALGVAAFAAKFPMQPRNPGTGGLDAKQLQAWVGGPDASTGEAVVVLVNYGPDQGQGGFGTSDSGTQNVTASYEDLGLTGTYNVRNVWQKEDLGSVSGGLSAILDEGESRLFSLMPA